MADELIDIYDSEMNLLGTAMKSQAHKEGLWHKAFHCWMVKGDKVWLQLRSKDKEIYPNLLDISAAGHIGAGEPAKQASIREIEEELGLSVSEREFEKLFTYKLVEDVGDQCVREFNPTYALKSRWKLEDVTMQPEEVDGIFEGKLADLIDLFEDDKAEIVIHGFRRGDKKPAEWKVSKANFAPRDKNYYLKVFSTLERLG